MNTIKFNDIELYNLKRDLLNKYDQLKKRANKLEFFINKLSNVSEYENKEMLRDLSLVMQIKNSKKNITVYPQKKEKNDYLEKSTEVKVIKPKIVTNKIKRSDLTSKILKEKKLSNTVNTQKTLQVLNSELPSVNNTDIKKVKSKKIIRSPKGERLEQSKWKKFNWKTWAMSILVYNGEQMNFDEMFKAFNQKYHFTGEDFKIARKSLFEGLLKLVKSGEVIKYMPAKKNGTVIYGLKRWEKFI